ncbi:MAG TPA: hypothetical protein DC049_18005 [Spirochaetia bacterium]|nr:hypothetical protein [Spirochaetia bacterium]
MFFFIINCSKDDRAKSIKRHKSAAENGMLFKCQAYGRVKKNTESNIFLKCRVLIICGIIYFLQI